MYIIAIETISPEEIVTAEAIDRAIAAAVAEAIRASHGNAGRERGAKADFGFCSLLRVGLHKDCYTGKFGSDK